MILTQRYAAPLLETHPFAAMGTIAPIPPILLSEGPVDAGFWPRLSTAVREACDRHAIAMRDAVVLLPYANLLTPARQAFAQTAGWQPRTETLRTLADALGPPPAWQRGQLAGDGRIDRLQAQRLLPAEGAAWAPLLADGAARLREAASAWPPAERSARWQSLQEAVPPIAVGAPGAIERSLVRAAMAWAAMGGTAFTDRLWQHRPSAWIVVVAGGRQAAVDALLRVAAAHGVPVLEVHTDPVPEAAFEVAARLPPPQEVVCTDAAHEAREAAWRICQAVQEGQHPVALVAHDRQLVRRIHAVLAQRGLQVHDDTGWALSTTHAAARTMAVLRALGQPGSRDAQLDGMKAMGWAEDEAAAIDELEWAWRRDRPPPPAAAAVAERWQMLCTGWLEAGAQPLSHWLAALQQRLAPLWSSLAGDAAGRAVLDALRLKGLDPLPNTQDDAWAAAMATPLSWPGFMVWVERALEEGSFLPVPPAQADVVITPLARTVLRPFAAVVFPGCDERFGAAAVQTDTFAWPEQVARSHGLPHERDRREREMLAFAQLLRQPRVVLLRRRSEAGEPLAASVWVQRAQWVRRQNGSSSGQEEVAPARVRALATHAAARPMPRLAAGSAVPERLSAARVEALRACPYRFFSRAVLGLGESSELDADWQQRDHGDWLHRVLHRFHAERAAPRAPAEDVAALHHARQQETEALPRDAAELLPYEAGFHRFAAHYVAWLQQRDADGWRYTEGEVARERALPGLDPPVQLIGRIDRIDTHMTTGDRQLLDYKTGNAKELQRRAREPLEDTQLAVYAALAMDGASALQAHYLALDDRGEPQAIVHPDAQGSAQTLLQALPVEIAQIREGAALPPLGEGRVCETCEARGLCRRDDWAPLS